MDDGYEDSSVTAPLSCTFQVNPSLSNRAMLQSSQRVDKSAVHTIALLQFSTRLQAKSKGLYHSYTQSNWCGNPTQSRYNAAPT